MNSHSDRRPNTPMATRCASPVDDYEFSSARFETENHEEGACEEEDEARDDSLPSLVILHKIASYLSVGDAESVGALSRSSNITNTSLFMPGAHSLDAWLTRDAGHDNYLQNNSFHDYQQTLSSIVDFEDEDSEGWFVGNQSESLPHMVLSPLDDDDQIWRCEQGEEGRRVWTPAGEPTCERNDSAEAMTPALTAVSCDSHSDDDSVDSEESSRNRREHRQRKRALQSKLAQAVFAHPHPLRDYCLDAYATAVRLSQNRKRQQQQQSQKQANPNPETLRHRPDISPSSKLHYCDGEMPELGEHDHQKAYANNSSTVIVQHPSKRKRQTLRKKTKILRVIFNKLLNSIPPSVLLDLLESSFDLSIHTIFAYVKITCFSAQTIISVTSNTTFTILDSLSSINIFELAHRSVNRTGEKLASGLQSVATGVGSASNAALERLSRQGLALAGAGLSRGGGGMKNGMQGKVVAVENPLESKVRVLDSYLIHDFLIQHFTYSLFWQLFRRLHKMDNVSKLVAYSERFGEEAFSRSQKKRAQRMMHYNVSFRPFTATIQPASPKKTGKGMNKEVSFDLSTKSPGSYNVEDVPSDNDSLSSESLSNTGSIFMRTPTSFPPTPTSR